MKICFGVTGSRKITDSPELEEKTSGVIKKVVSEYVKMVDNKNTEEERIISSFSIISPLAEGADRMLVKILRRTINAELEAVLPMQKKEYEQTFISEESVCEFEMLLNEASMVKTLTDIPAQSSLDNNEKIKSMELAFQKAGRYVVDNCDILIALWNGYKNNKIGGTFDTISYAKKIRKKIVIISPEYPFNVDLSGITNITV